MYAVKVKNNQLIHVRWMIRRDMPEVMEIERDCFSEPWIEDDFIKRLRQRNAIGMVAEVDGRTIGFMVYELRQYSLLLLRVAVSPWFQRVGIGTALIDKLKSKLWHDRRTTLMAEVPDRMLEAHLFFRAMELRASIMMRDRQNGCDDYLFRYTIEAEGQ